MPNKIYSNSFITLDEIPSDCFYYYYNDDDKSKITKIVNIENIIAQANYTGEISKIKNALGQVIPKGVQKAPTGVIQDPAGSAIGSKAKPSGLGASGSIYSKFPDLDPIPDIPTGASVFNSSSGEGKRVIHTFSPNFGSLMLDPSVNKDRTKALNALTNCYINVFIASAESDHNFSEIALVPISGKIYADKFINTELNHLDPSFTITSIILALGYLLKNDKKVLKSDLYYYTGQDGKDDGAFNEATKIMNAIKSE